MNAGVERGRRDPDVRLPAEPSASGDVLRQTICLPARLALDGKVFGSPIRQLDHLDYVEEAEVVAYEKRGQVRGQLASCSDGRTVLFLHERYPPPADVDAVLLLPEEGQEATGQPLVLGQGAQWLKPKPNSLNIATRDEWVARAEAVRASWAGSFAFREEQREHGEVVAKGLRSPQLGALYAALAHWTVTPEPGTIVMPTGTGKTETMLALLVHQQLERLLVVVPTNALREQIANKFLTLGELKPAGVVNHSALFPLVGTLERRPQTPDEVRIYFQLCNVVVTTMAIIGGCSEDVQRAMAEWCSHLFIDEAHHVTAPTWAAFRRHFRDRPILQFTATPFRRDGKHVPGKMLFRYPLRKAQEEGYFKPITFRAVSEYNPVRADEAIARLAVEQLEQDLAEPEPLDHIIMARTDSIERAHEVYEVYRTIGAAHHPQIVHSGMTAAGCRDAIDLLRERRSRLVVCVNMFGEGFDLPSLKIAALHDVHKSLAPTIQFTGRFTRSGSTIGAATVIANTADTRVEEALRALYAEDADWNTLLRYLGEGAADRQIRQAQFLEGFPEIPDGIPIQNLFPKMSTVVYRTNAAHWRPDRLPKRVQERLYSAQAVNEEQKVLLFVTRELIPVPWGDIKELADVVWNLYVIHWDQEQGLLFINSSDNGSLHDDLVETIVGDGARLIRGEEVFRSLAGVNWLILMNLGLKHSFSRAIRFTMYVGADIKQGLAEALQHGKFKSNLFGRGFEHGEKTSIGCSYKGRMWSHKVARDIPEWVAWCHEVGAKLLDERIDPQEILKHVLVPRRIQERPPLVPLSIEWSEDFLGRSEDAVYLAIAEELVPLYEVGLELVDPSRDGPLRFRISGETNSAEYDVVFRENTVEYVPVGDATVDIVTRRRESLTSFLQRESPVLRFENGAFLIYDALFEPDPTQRSPFDREQIEVWNWEGTNIRKESQYDPPDFANPRLDSIQYRTMQELLRPGQDPDFDIVFDDDERGEAADIVALKVANDRLIVHLYHCKYAGGDNAGARLDDLYVVCGQAQRSVYRRGDVAGLFDHLRLREVARVEKCGVSRFARGSLEHLEQIKRQVPFLEPECTICIVQPGLSQGQASAGQLELLAVTKTYLLATSEVPLRVVGSA